MQSVSSRPLPPRLAERKRAERRTANRIRPLSLMACRISHPDGSPVGMGVVHDLSTTGVCLLVGVGRKPGDLLEVLLTNAGCTYALSIRLEVVRCHSLVSGAFYVAGRFDHALEPLEMQPLLL
jgi:hypothetical protein